MNPAGSLLGACLPALAAGAFLAGCSTTEAPAAPAPAAPAPLDAGPPPPPAESPAPVPEDRLPEARDLASRGRVREALEVLASVLAVQPDRVDVRLEKANLHRLLRQHGLARREIDEVLRAQPAHPLALLMGAENRRVDRTLDDEGKALMARDLDLLVGAHPGLSAAFVARADMRFQFTGGTDGVKADIEAALKIDPDQAEALGMRAYYAMIEGRYEDGIRDAERAATSDPDMPRLCFLWGQWAESSRDWPCAEACYALAERLGMGGWRPAGALAYVERRLGKYEECLASCTRSIALEKPGVRMLRQRGMTLHYLGRLEEAERDLDAAVAGGYLDALYTRGTLHFRKGDMARARADFDACAEAEGVWADFRDYSRLRVWQIDGILGKGPASDGALREYLDVRKSRGPDDWFRFLALAVLKEPRQALDCLEAGLAVKHQEEIHERTSELMYYLGVSRKRRGDAKGARAHFERCVEIDVKWLDEYWCARDELAKGEGK